MTNIMITLVICYRRQANNPRDVYTNIYVPDNHAQVAAQSFVVVCCAHRQGTLFLLSQSTQLKRLPDYAGMDWCFIQEEPMIRSHLLSTTETADKHSPMRLKGSSMDSTCIAKTNYRTFILIYSEIFLILLGS